MSTVLVVGANGQLGEELVARLSANESIAVACNRSALDLRDVDSIEAVIARQQYDTIVNCAAYTAVDKAEQDSELAYLINRDAPQQMAKVAKTCGARFIHISTDFVFDGAKSEPYIESDAPCPLGIYGKSKLAGELAVMEANDQAMIVRTSWLYSRFRKSFVTTMLKLAQERDVINVVDDQIGSPTWARDLAADLLAANSLNLTGVYHYANIAEISWYEFAVYIVNRAREVGFSIRAQEVLPIPTSEYPTLAIRPKYSALNSSKFSAKANVNINDWKVSLDKMLADLKAAPV